MRTIRRDDCVPCQFRKEILNVVYSHTPTYIPYYVDHLIGERMNVSVLTLSPYFAFILRCRSLKRRYLRNTVQRSSTVEMRTSYS